jgi:hypothetical protein
MVVAVYKGVKKSPHEAPRLFSRGRRDGQPGVLISMSTEKCEASKSLGNDPTGEWAVEYGAPWRVLPNMRVCHLCKCYEEITGGQLPRAAVSPRNHRQGLSPRYALAKSAGAADGQLEKIKQTTGERMPAEREQQEGPPKREMVSFQASEFRQQASELPTVWAITLTRFRRRQLDFPQTRRDEGSRACLPRPGLSSGLFRPYVTSLIHANH